MATASTVRRWLLIERNGPWGATALAECRIEPSVARRIGALGRSLGARVLLVRRPGRYTQSCVTVFAAHSGGRGPWLERLSFESYEAVLEHDFSGLRASVGGTVGGDAAQEPVFFICTDGKHDACCARHGRPVAKALASAFGERAWETSHIGGDRFASNVLVLPWGVYYGRVPEERAVALAAQLSGGELDLTHYRGRSTYSFGAQAAERFVREQFGLLGVDDLLLTRHVPGSDGLSQTVFRLRDGRCVAVDVVSTPDVELHRLTCRAVRPQAAPRHRLISLRVVSEDAVPDGTVSEEEGPGSEASEDEAL